MYTYFKGYKVRLYPTKEQEKMFWKHIHTCRALWNIMLEQNMLRYDILHAHMNYYDMAKLLTGLKEMDEYSWLKEVSNASLQRVCRNLNTAYEKFFNKSTVNRHPKFKNKRHAKRIFPVNPDNNKTYIYSGTLIHIPKCGKVKYKFDYRKENIDLFNIKFFNPYITYTSNGKWILSFEVEYENQVLDNKNYSLGIDMGLRRAATYSYRKFDGFVVTEFVENINKNKKLISLDRKINHIHTSINRKYMASKKYKYDVYSSNRFKTEVEKLRKLYYHRTNIIRDYYHKITSHIVYDIRPSYIIMEDLNIKKLLKNGYISYSVAKANWGEFFRKILYKADACTIPVHKVPRFYPSSLLCSNCGAKRKLKNSQTQYLCHECGLIIDRDINASINLMNYKQGL